MVWRHVRRLITFAAVLLVVAFGLGLLFLHLQNMRVLSVQSGSMAPAINQGDLVVVSSVPEAEIKPGDVVTFTHQTNQNVLITHRVVEVLPDGQIITKGDANETADAPISADRLAGRVTQTIPYVGQALDFVRQPIGLLIVVYVPALIIVASEIKRLSRHFKDNQGYRHPLMPRRAVKRPAPSGVKLSIIAIMIASLTAVPIWAQLSSSATLGPSTISAIVPEPVDHLVLRQVLFRCMDGDEVNTKPSITIYNPTDETFEVGGWYLESTNGRLKTFDEDQEFNRGYNWRRHIELDDGLIYAGDFLALKNAEGETIDAISWGSDTSIFDPALPVADPGELFERDPADIDTNSASDWETRQLLCPR